jgi:hypothetical protein
MKITGKGSLAGFLKIMIDMILVINILVLISLPLMLNTLYDNTKYVNESASSDEISSRAGAESDTRESQNVSGTFLNEIPKESYTFMLVFLYFSGAITAAMLFLLRKVLKNLENNLILNRTNSKIFKQMSLSCFALVITLIIKMLFYNTFMTIFTFFVFIVIGMFLIVLSEVFLQGAIAKEENELTI